MKIKLPDRDRDIFLKVQSMLKDLRIYVVGGYVRDLLLGLPSQDLDFAVASTPEEIDERLLLECYKTRYGTFSFTEDGYHITLACLRKEKRYLDFRHPAEISFDATLDEDAMRRDFTINALYLTMDGEILDPPGNGVSDLKQRKIRMIGDPDLRIKEDPLRILRSYRFKDRFDFEIEQNLTRSIMNNKELLNQLREDKIKDELRKFSKEGKESMIKELSWGKEYL